MPLLPLRRSVTKLCKSSFALFHQHPRRSRSDIYDYIKVKGLVDLTPSKDGAILIDVREPSETAAGSIPTSVNMPSTKMENAWQLSPKEFQEAFGFEKPEKDKELVFYCFSGVRSTHAAMLAEQAGYTKTGNYVGSWQDWLEKSK